MPLYSYYDGYGDYIQWLHSVMILNHMQAHYDIWLASVAAIQHIVV